MYDAPTHDSMSSLTVDPPAFDSCKPGSFDRSTANPLQKNWEVMDIRNI
jgi:hypothetical protein